MRVSWIHVLALLLCLGCGPVHADEKAKPVDPDWHQIADQVKAALEQGELAQVETALARIEVDAWFMADVFVGRGDPETARKLAQAFEGPAVAGLPAYLDRLRRKPLAPEVRGALDDGVRALLCDDFLGALREFEKLKDAAPTVPSIWTFGRRSGCSYCAVASAAMSSSPPCITWPTTGFRPTTTSVNW